MALVAKGLGYVYEAGTPYSVRALADVDVRVEPGEMLVIAGTTGSGKSTLLRLLAGLLEPATGSIEVDGLSPRSRNARGRVAIVFQNPESQFFAETVLADVEFGPRNLGLGDPSVAARRALDAVGLDVDAFGPRSPFSLSGGEARRAAIAGALAMGAPYLLLDEPTVGLDARGRRDVLSAITLERNRAGVVVVTHDPDEFLASATGVLVVSGGEGAFSGTTTAFMNEASADGVAGVRLPEVARVQLLARERGAEIDRIRLDPEDAASVLLSARAASR